jgi:hypothetical protein
VAGNGVFGVLGSDTNGERLSLDARGTDTAEWESRGNWKKCGDEWSRVGVSGPCHMARGLNRLESDRTPDVGCLGSDGYLYLSLITQLVVTFCSPWPSPMASPRQTPAVYNMRANFTSSPPPSLPACISGISPHTPPTRSSFPFSMASTATTTPSACSLPPPHHPTSPFTPVP